MKTVINYHTKMVSHVSGVTATFGFCDTCDREDYLTTGSYTAQDRQANSICFDCKSNRNKYPRFRYSEETPDYLKHGNQLTLWNPNISVRIPDVRGLLVTATRN